MSRFTDEIGIIPRVAWGVAALIYAALAVMLSVLLHRDRNVPWLLMTVLPVIAPLIPACVVLLIGYINGDARRRGMRYVMWTLLAIFVPNAIGIILYFVLRDPLPVFCPQCAAPVARTHTFCPHCGGALKTACPQCRRAAESGWKNCAFCGARL